MRKFLAGLLPAALLTSALVAAPVAHAATTTLSPANPIKMENFYFHSSQPTRFIRPVELQKQQAGRWKTIYTGHTDANGKFRFTVHTGSTDTLRGYSPTTTYKGHSYPRIGTTPITVRPLDQKVSLSVSPGRAVAPGSAFQATVETSPARDRRAVDIQRKDGGVWRTIASGKVAANGRGVFHAIPVSNQAGAYQYRALAGPFNGAGRMGSSSVTVNVVLPQVPDERLRICINKKLNLPEGNAAWTDAQVKSVTNLFCAYSGSLNGLERFTGLTSLQLYALPGSTVPDLTRLKGLTKLVSLNLSGNHLTDVSSLRGLTALTDLDLSNNDLTDLSALSGLTHLDQLNLSENKLSSTSGLGALTSLTRLDLSENQITDISDLSKLSNLVTLSAWGNQISDASPVADLQKLESIDLKDNPVCTAAPETRGCSN